MSSYIELRYTGALVAGNRIPLFELASAMASLQTSITRAFLYNKHGTVWKHARIRSSDLIAAAFYIDLQSVSEGSLRFKFKGLEDLQKQIVDRINTSLNKAWDEITRDGVVFSSDLAREYEARITSLRAGQQTPLTFEEFVNRSPEQIVRNYGDRSISKEFDQILRPVKRGDAGLDIYLRGQTTASFSFDQIKAKKFSKLVSQRTLGPPIQYRVSVKKLDYEQKTANVTNNETNKSCVLHFRTDEEFNAIRASFSPDQELVFIGCPVIEYGAFDPNRGDLYFLQINSADGDGQ